MDTKPVTLARVIHLPVSKTMPRGASDAWSTLAVVAVVGALAIGVAILGGF